MARKRKKKRSSRFGLKSNGKLKKGCRFARGGRVVCKKGAAKRRRRRR